MTFTTALTIWMLLSTAQTPPQPTEVSPSPVQPSPTSPSPVQPTGVQPTPVRPAPAPPTNVEAAEVAPAEVSPTAVSPNATQTQITLETDAGVVEGALVDETSTGYLVLTSTGTRLVPYSQVKRVSRGVAAVTPPRLAPPTPQTAQPAPPLPAGRTDVSASTSASLAAGPATAGEGPPATPSMFMGVGYVLNMNGRHGRSLAVPPTTGGQTLLGSGPDRTLAFELVTGAGITTWMGAQLSFGFDALGDFTYQRLVDPGGSACVDSGLGGQCFTFDDGMNFNTLTLMGTLWLRAAYPLGPVRIWGGVGAALAWVQGNYEPGTWGGITYGQFESLAFGVPVGAGVELLIGMPGGGPKIVLFTKTELGSPVYGANALLFDDQYRWQTSAVGHAVDSLRLVGGVAFEL